jgi:hypothetical protein
VPLFFFVVMSSYPNEPTANQREVSAGAIRR